MYIDSSLHALSMSNLVRRSIAHRDYIEASRSCHGRFYYFYSLSFSSICFYRVLFFFFYSFLHLVSLFVFIFTFFFFILFISKSGAPVHVRIFSRARLRRLSVRPRVNNLAYKFIYFRSRFRVSRYLVSLIVNVVTISFFRCVIRLPFISLSPTHTLYFLNLSETSLSDVFLFFFFCFDTHGF